MPADTGEVVTIPLDKLRYGPKVRSESVDLDHVARLCAVLDACPPIVVRSGCMEVLDGNHRVTAAKNENRSGIRAVLVSCNEAEALEHAVKANTTHGKPLTALERRHAAEKLIAKTEWSDRRIAEACGISHPAVASLRPTGKSDQLDTTGADGRRRPASRSAAVAQRETAVEELRKDPTQSARSLARKTGLSPTTAAGVKAAIDSGADPIPSRFQPTVVPAGPDNGEVSVGDLLIILPRPWAKHSACQRSSITKQFGLFMDRRVENARWEKFAGFVDHVPAELVPAALAEADAMAACWSRFATELRNRDHTLEAMQ